jgi:hypothetical protein
MASPLLCERRGDADGGGPATLPYDGINRIRF